MKRIPFTNSILMTCQEAEVTADALEQAAEVNMDLLARLFSATEEEKQYREFIATQIEVVNQIMQINLLTAGALGRIRDGEDVEEVCLGLEAQLAEFGDPPVRIDLTGDDSE